MNIFFSLDILVHEVHGGAVEEGGVVDGPDEVQVCVLILLHSAIDNTSCSYTCFFGEHSHLLSNSATDCNTLFEGSNSSFFFQPKTGYHDKPSPIALVAKFYSVTNVSNFYSM